MGQCKRDRWIRIVASEDGPASSTTRLVLLVLASHMDLDGGSCFPSVRTLVRETGLSNRSVVVHLALADKDGWIERTESGTDQGWKRHIYQAVFPARLEPERGAADAPPFGEGGEPPSMNVVNLLPSTQLYNKPSISRTKRGARRAPPSRV